MRKILLSILLTTATVPAMAGEPIALRDMGSFHIGGRIAEVTGQEPRMIVRQPGGPNTTRMASSSSSRCMCSISCRRIARENIRC